MGRYTARLLPGVDPLGATGCTRSLAAVERSGSNCGPPGVRLAVLPRTWLVCSAGLLAMVAAHRDMARQLRAAALGEVATSTLLADRAEQHASGEVPAPYGGVGR